MLRQSKIILDFFCVFGWGGLVEGYFVEGEFDAFFDFIVSQYGAGC